MKAGRCFQMRSTRVIHGVVYVYAVQYLATMKDMSGQRAITVMCRKKKKDKRRKAKTEVLILIII